MQIDFNFLQDVFIILLGVAGFVSGTYVSVAAIVHFLMKGDGAGSIFHRCE